jgi:hypothetical protein
MKNRNNNSIIDRTINIFRDYMREQAAMLDSRSFENARQCRIVAREGGFLAKFDRAVAADKALRVFTDNDYKYGRAVGA